MNYMQFLKMNSISICPWIKLSKTYDISKIIARGEMVYHLHIILYSSFE